MPQKQIDTIIDALQKALYSNLDFYAESFASNLSTFTRSLRNSFPPLIIITPPTQGPNGPS